MQMCGSVREYVRQHLHSTPDVHRIHHQTRQITDRNVSTADECATYNRTPHATRKKRNRQSVTTKSQSSPKRRTTSAGRKVQLTIPQKRQQRDISAQARTPEENGARDTLLPGQLEHLFRPHIELLLFCMMGIEGLDCSKSGEGFGGNLSVYG